MVLGPGFHDGSFYGVIVEDAGCIAVFVRNYKQEPLVIRLINVVNFSLNNFWGGSIIGDVWFFEKKEAPVYMWEKMLREKLSSANYEQSFNRIISNKDDSFFFALECSYGGELYATCSGMNIVSGK